MKITQKEIALLWRIKDRITPQTLINAVYITPAQALRDQADQLEREACDGILFNALIEKLSKE